MKFEVGDKVALYQGYERYTGTIVSIEANGVLHVSANKNVYMVNPKQCRKIVKRNVYYWVKAPEYGYGPCVCTEDHRCDSGIKKECVRVRVIRKEQE